MKRKDFIKQSCLACMGIAASGVIIGGLSSCATFPVIKISSEENIVRVPLSQISSSNLNIIRPSKLDYDIFVSLNENKTFTCLVMKCTHQDWNLITNPKGFNCSLHGSMFDLTGRVINGPADKPLVRLKSFIIEGEDFLNIQTT